LDYDFGWLLGLYLAEGSANRYQTVWSLGAHETELVNRCSAIAERFGARIRHETRRSITKVIASMPMIEPFWSDFGHAAHDKRLPAWIWDAPDAFLSGLVDGWHAGDGDTNNTARRVTTVSQTLAWQMRLVLLRLGYSANITTREPQMVTIEGREHATRTAYLVAWRSTERGAAVMGDGFASYSLNSAGHDQTPTTVYNLSVMEDESYTTTGGTVHNCADFPYGEFDDLVDTVTMCLLWLRKSFLEFADEQDMEDDTPEPGASVAGGARRLYG
jgi:hypothetical protein